MLWPVVWCNGTTFKTVHLGCFYTLKTVAAVSSEMLVLCVNTMSCHIPKDHNVSIVHTAVRISCVIQQIYLIFD
jgi:hypothetical protein